MSNGVQAVVRAIAPAFALIGMLAGAAPAQERPSLARLKDEVAAEVASMQKLSQVGTTYGVSGSGPVSTVYTFHGKSAHGAGSPWAGRSALDVVEPTNGGWNYRREHLRLQQRSHSDGRADVREHRGGRVNEEKMAEYRPLLERLRYDPSRYSTYLEQLGIEYPVVRERAAVGGG